MIKCSDIVNLLRPSGILIKKIKIKTISRFAFLVIEASNSDLFW